MEIELINIGKRYHGKWLFRHLNVSLQSGDTLSVTGRNGSGKSTFMQIVYGLAQATEGQVHLNGFNNPLPHKVFAYTAPYLELPMEFSVQELFNLYRRAGKSSMETDRFMAFSGFEGPVNQRPIRLFSSGMLQKFKTALCLASDAPVILLDEPLSNMDSSGEQWYKNCMSDIGNRIVIVAGNNPAEFGFAEKNIHLQI